MYSVETVGFFQEARPRSLIPGNRPAGRRIVSVGEEEAVQPSRKVVAKKKLSTCLLSASGH
jgi:hypothetical protein